jgi:hypothetical protein
MRHPAIAFIIIRGESISGFGGGNVWFIDGVFYGYFVLQSFMAKIYPRAC